MLFSVKEIYQKTEKISQLERIKVGGWVKSIRKSKEIIFIILNDGSTLANLQIIMAQKLFSPTDLPSKINFGSSLLVSGKLVLTPQRAQSCELQVETIEFFKANQ